MIGSNAALRTKPVSNRWADYFDRLSMLPLDLIDPRVKRFARSCSELCVAAEDPFLPELERRALQDLATRCAALIGQISHLGDGLAKLGGDLVGHVNALQMEVSRSMVGLGQLSPSAPQQEFSSVQPLSDSALEFQAFLKRTASRQPMLPAPKARPHTSPRIPVTELSSIRNSKPKPPPRWKALAILSSCGVLFLGGYVLSLRDRPAPDVTPVAQSKVPQVTSTQPNTPVLPFEWKQVSAVQTDSGTISVRFVMQNKAPGLLSKGKFVISARGPQGVAAHPRTKYEFKFSRSTDIELKDVGSAQVVVQVLNEKNEQLDRKEIPIKR